jgi:hypothetical protein
MKVEVRFGGTYDSFSTVEVYVKLETKMKQTINPELHNAGRLLTFPNVYWSMELVV